MKALIILLIASSAYAQNVKKPVPPKPDPKEKTFNIGPLELGGRVRTISLLSFIERANDELERSSLEKKSFIPKIVSSLDEEQL